MKVKVALHGYKAAAVSRARGYKDEDSDVLFGVTRTDEIKDPGSIRGRAHVSMLVCSACIFHDLLCISACIFAQSEAWS